MTHSPGQAYVSRGGEKLAAALDHFDVDPSDWVCADLGSHVGGFVDCLLQRGARRVLAVDTAYGTFAWKLRRDARVVLSERTNAMHVSLPEPVDLVTIDVGWTPQAKVLPNAATLLRPGGIVLTLIKPHYEATKAGGEGPKKPVLVDGVVPDDAWDEVVGLVLINVRAMGWSVAGTFTSPIRGHGGNREVFALLSRNAGDSPSC